ncbi:balbiani ring protein 3-like [Dendronephthya gigantea]|uniref:balbiani ring protein 3-like n=1 Tax=Dendronephthya gigantea TaxID=151771 RepID=UPI00106C94CD|nr:balbiani ring protein 3-like [Dendronephthya gigantea]
MRCYEVITLVLALSAIVSHIEAAKKADPANCQPWRVPVAVDAPNHNSRPFYVELHRCMGQCDNISPLRCECVDQTSQDISMMVTTTGGLKSQVFKNHTSCKTQCKADYKAKCLQKGHQWDEQTCSCTCPNPPAGTCTLTNNRWNAGTCQCECKPSLSGCPPNKFWNKSICGCQCTIKAFTRCSNIGRATDMSTCKCKRPKPVASQVVNGNKNNESEKKYVISLAATGVLLAMLLVIDLILMRKEKGFLYSVMNCHKKKRKGCSANPELTGSQNNLDTHNHNDVASV